jgi:hypothetical protein
VSTSAKRPELRLVLDGVRADADVLKRNGQAVLASSMLSIVSAVSDATEEYDTWLGELACAQRSGWTPETVRRWARKFGESPHVRYTKGVGYELRACLVPRRVEASLLIASAHRASA